MQQVPFLVYSVDMSRKKSTVNTRGIARLEFFKIVGDLARWRGRATIFRDRKLEASVKACRKRVDSQE